MDFQKSCISGITVMSAFKWHTSLVMTPPTPSNEPCTVRDVPMILSCPVCLETDWLVSLLGNFRSHSALATKNLKLQGGGEDQKSVLRALSFWCLKDAP